MLFIAGTNSEIITAVKTATRETSVNFELGRVVLEICITNFQYAKREKP